MKYFNYVIGLIGSFVASLFGGWSLAIETLLLFMAIDYITGLIVAGLFNNSPKTDTGGLKSSIGFKGLCRKGMILLYVLIAYRIDLVLGVNYIKDCICIAFICNELISILENLKDIGVPMPAFLMPIVKNIAKKTEETLNIEEEEHNHDERN